MRSAKTIICLLVVQLFLFSPAAYADFPQSGLEPASVPPYTEDSDYYIDINDGVPDFEVWQRTAFPVVLFSPLDDLGRAGAAYACLGPETLPTDVRKPIWNFQPSGWQSIRYEDLVDGGSLFNRSHLIDYQLCGDSDSRETDEGGSIL